MNDEIRHLLGRAAKGHLSRRDFLGRASALGLSLITADSLLAQAVRAEGPKKGGHLKLGLGGGESTNTLDPALALTQVAYNYLRQMGDVLVRMSPAGELENRLAESVESSKDAKVWRFKIRKGVEFHDGKTLTADDVVKTMQRHSNERAKSGALGVMKGIASMRADGDVFEATLATANADFPYLMADYHLVIQPNGGMDDAATKIGCGPYKIVQNEPGVRHAFERFANYWDKSCGHFDSTEILVINDATARTAALQSGQVHMINQIEPKIAGLLKRAPGVAVKNVAGRGHYVFIMHCNTAPFDNKDLRMALKYAINRKEMVEKILMGYGAVGNDVPINGAYPLFTELPQREYDPEKAAFHYKKSGHDGAILLRTADGAFPGAVDAAQLFQQSAQKAGIKLEVKREPNDGYWTEVWNKQPFCASYWQGRPVQDQMYSTAYASDAEWNDTRFFNKDFDALILKARAELDAAKRKEMYKEAAVMIHDDGGLICPMFNHYIDAHGPKIMGWADNPNGEMMNGYAAAQCWMA